MVDLNEALQALSEILGLSVNEAVLSRNFLEVLHREIGALRKAGPGKVSGLFKKIGFLKKSVGGHSDEFLRI